MPSQQEQRNDAVDQRYYCGLGLVPRDDVDVRKLTRLLRHATAPSQWTRKVALPAVQFFGWESDVACGPLDTHERFRVRSQSGRGHVYRYDFAAQWVGSGRNRMIVLLFPFMKVERLVTQALIENGLLKEALFARSNVQGIVEAVGGGRHAGGRIRIAKLVSRVEDDGIRRIAFGGADAVHSRIYRHLVEEFGRTTFQARSCIVAMDGAETGRLSTHLDNFGNLRFWVTSGMRNIGSIVPLFAFLGTLRLWQTSTAIPYERLELDEQLEE